jgi:uncharacterized protein (TIGR03382 family)
MTSSLDAVEMTTDPVFVQNPDMAEVSNTRQADFVFECTGGKKRDKAKRRLELADGREISIPSINWLDKNDMTEFEYIKDLGIINAQIIEQTGASGQPNVLFDFTDQLFSDTEQHNRALLSCGGCSAANGTPWTGAWMLGLAAFAWRRRPASSKR